MKLAVLHDKPRNEMGGMTRFIAAQNALFVAAGWSVVELICTPTPQPNSVHVLPSGRRIGLAALNRLRAFLHHEQPDAMLVHSPYFALSPLTLQALSSHVPLIYVLHDVTPLCPRMTRLRRDAGICHARQGIACLTSGCYRPGQDHGVLSDIHGLVMRNWQMRAARSVPQWVVPSQYLKALLCAHGIDGDRAAVIPHFVGAGNDGLIDKPLGQAIEGRIFFAGRLVPEKGIHCLLDALTFLPDIAWQLHIAGDGPELASIQKTIAERGWRHRVHCLGVLDAKELTQQYQEATVVAMPSLIPESFGLVGLEAMRQRRPVVGFASGGMTQWLRHGVSGLVAEWGSPHALAQQLHELLTQPGRAAQMGGQGYALAVDEFSAQRHLKGMQDLLHALVKK